MTIEDGATLTIREGAVVKFCPGSKLWVKPGGKLELEGKLTSLKDEGWKGIEVDGNPAVAQELGMGNTSDDHGIVFATSTAVIENAITGIYAGATAAKAGGIILCNGTTFHNNKIGTVIANYKNFTDISIFNECNFITDGDYKLSDHMYYGARLVYGRGVEFENCTFENSTLLKSSTSVNGTSNYGAGIFSIASGLKSKGCQYIGLNYGIYLGLNGKTTYSNTITGNTFSSCLYGIVNLGRASVFIKNNTFNINDNIPTESGDPQVGIYLYSSILGQTIEENDFVREAQGNRYSVGILAGWTGSFYNRLNLNSFEGLDVGTETFGKNGEKSDFNISGLSYICNTFVDINLHDFYITFPNNYFGMNPIQSNPVPLGGDAFNYGAQNIFSEASIAKPRKDFLNKNTTLPIRYIFKSGPTPRYEPYFYTPGGLLKDEIFVSTACPTAAFTNLSKSTLASKIFTAKSNLSSIASDLEFESDSIIIDSLESLAAYHSSVLHLAGTDMIEVLDSSNAPLDSVIVWLEIFENLSADIMIAERLADNGDIIDALAKLADIPMNHDLETEEENDLTDLATIYDLDQYNNADSISLTNYNDLRALVFSGYQTSCAARSILGIKGEFYELPFFDPNNEVLPRKYSVEFESISIRLYPNPTNGLLNVDLGNEYNQASIIAYDMMGQQILASQLTKGNNILNINKSHSGIVVYNIYDALGKIIKTGKLVLVK